MWIPASPLEEGMPYKDKEKAKESQRERSRRYRERHLEKVKEKDRRASAAKYAEVKGDPEFKKKRKAFSASLYKKKKEIDPDWIKSLRSSTKEYLRNNPHIRSIHTVAKRVKHKDATPKWLDSCDMLNMRGIYLSMSRVSACTGIQFNVDHIVPLVSDIVCGLHVPWNLQIIPATLNRKKHNHVYNQTIQDGRL
jgi:hypothetical protein